MGVDLDTGTAEIIHETRRQLATLSPRWTRKDAEALADEVAEAICERRLDDERLTWRSDNRAVQVRTSEIIPRGGSKETFDGRRKRLLRLGTNGWSRSDGLVTEHG